MRMSRLATDGRLGSITLIVAFIAIACTNGRSEQEGSTGLPLRSSASPEHEGTVTHSSAGHHARVVSITQPPGARRVQIVGLDGASLRSVPNLPPDAFDVELSPDGRTIAFASIQSGASQIYSMGIDGSGLRPLTHDRLSAFGPTWSPDGRSIAYTGSARGTLDIYAVPATGGGRVRYTNDPGIDELQPSWSPDGSRIMFAAPVARGAASWLPGQGIRVLKIASGRITQVTSGADSMPEWSPRGDRMAFLRQPDPVMGGYRNKLMVARVDGTDARTLVTMRFIRFASALYWSPDGTTISATAAAASGRYGVYLFDVAKGSEREVVPKSFGGNWLPTGDALLVRLTGGGEEGCAWPPSRC
jgi:Tol biopolymer transport system component